MKKRYVSKLVYLLVFAMVLSLLPVTVMAASVEDASIDAISNEMLSYGGPGTAIGNPIIMQLNTPVHVDLTSHQSSRWLRFTAPTAGTFTFTTSNETNHAHLRLVTPASVQIAAVHGRPASLTRTLAAGESALIRGEMLWSQAMTGSYSLTVTRVPEETGWVDTADGRFFYYEGEKLVGWWDLAIDFGQTAYPGLRVFDHTAGAPIPGLMLTGYVWYYSGLENILSLHYIADDGIWVPGATYHNGFWTAPNGDFYFINGVYQLGWLAHPDGGAMFIHGQWGILRNITYPIYNHYTGELVYRTFNEFGQYVPA